MHINYVQQLLDNHINLEVQIQVCVFMHLSNNSTLQVELGNWGRFEGLLLLCAPV